MTTTDPLLDGLNPQQQKAVAHAGSPLLVVAGAGSGKTRVLTRRIAYIMARREVRPYEILAITFTNKAAGEMKERVSELVGPVAKSMWVSTFHSSCVRMLRQEVERLDRAKLSALKERIDGMLSTSPLLRNFQNQIRLDITSEGLRIQIVDENNRPMFDSGRAVLKDYSRGILHEISRALNEVDNKISISGHTDAQPFVSGDRGYSNWELSADRSNAARREMVVAGIDEQKMVRVVGLASSIPLVPDDPFDPRNRRISIIVLNKKAEEAVMRPVPALDISNSSAVSQQLAPPAAGLPASALSSFPSPRK